jgi:hypothetical protein
MPAVPLRGFYKEPPVKRPTFQWPGLRKILPDIAAFTIGLGTAWALKWETTDLVWSLWLCSLVLGYLTILSTIGSGVYLGLKVISGSEFPQTYRRHAIGVGALAGLFFLGFFSLHFCGFHAGHAVFLSVFFPLKGFSMDVFSSAFMNPFLLWKTVFRHILPVYGLFLIPTILAERNHVFAALSAALATGREISGTSRAKDAVKSGLGSQKPLQDSFTRPYLNVIRMHILIFFFAISHALKVDSFFVYAVVYSVYFFPWNAFQKESNSPGKVVC